MKKLILLILILLFSFAEGQAKLFDAIIYCGARTPALDEHWKAQVPDLGGGELIQDFRVLFKYGDRIVVHALIQTDTGIDGQIARVKDYIRNFNGCTAPTLMGPGCTTSVIDQILIWWGETTEEAYKNLWKDRGVHPVYELLAYSILRYKVNCIIEGEPASKIVSVADAIDIYQVVIDPLKILIPHRFYGR